MKEIVMAGICLALIQGVVIAQQMYQWKDANGQVHYTDNPAVAMQAKAKTVEIPTAQKVNSTTDVSDVRIQERRAQEAQQAQQKAQMATNLANLEQNCQNSRNFIQSLKRMGRITVPDTSAKDGFRYLSDEEIKDYIAKKEADYNSRCGGL